MNFGLCGIRILCGRFLYPFGLVFLYIVLLIFKVVYRCLKLQYLRLRTFKICLCRVPSCFCILISLLLERQDARGAGVDVSPEALEVAKENASLLKVENRADFLESDLFSAPYFCEKGGKEGGKYDILISNPPYIATEEIETLMEEVRLHDPRKALDGMEDGLYFYRKITKEAGKYLKPGGWLLYEIGCTQGEAVSEMLRNAGFEKVQVVKDLPGLDRVVMGQKPL